MFDIGWSELVVIGVVALIVIGPKELPGVLRMVGLWIGKVRRMASDFQGQFQEAMREAEMADLKKQVDEFGDVTRDMAAQFDPLKPMQEALDDSLGTKPRVAVPNSELDAAEFTPAPVDTASAADTASDPAFEPATAPAEAALSRPDDASAEAAPPPQKAAAGGHSA